MNAIHVHIMNKMQNAFLRIINDFHCKDNACKFSIFFSHVTKKMLVCALSIFSSLVNEWLKIVLWYIEISCLYIYRCIISFPVFLSSAVNINIFCCDNKEQFYRKTDTYVFLFHTMWNHRKCWDRVCTLPWAEYFY